MDKTLKTEKFTMQKFVNPKSITSTYISERKNNNSNELSEQTQSVCTNRLFVNWQESLVTKYKFWETRIIIIMNILKYCPNEDNSQNLSVCNYMYTVAFLFCPYFYSSQHTLTYLHFNMFG